MILVSSCLDKSSLNAMAQGLCQEPLLSWYLWHIEQCPVCSEKLEAEMLQDGIGGLLREFGGAIRTIPHSNQYISPNPGVSDTDLTSVMDSLQNLTPALQPPNLAPACEPDEIGRIKDYRVLQQIGVGHFAVVYEAEDLWLNRRVALKILRKDLANGETGKYLFLAEAKAIASIQHPNIVPILHIGQSESEIFIVMPLLKGMSLREALCERQFSLNQALKILRDCACGLAAAHDIGLLHCDLKPNNIWLVAQADGTEKAVLLDFGLTALNSVNLVAGTPGFMAPEQIQGSNVSSQTDIFGLGCLLLAMLHPHCQDHPSHLDFTEEESSRYKLTIRPAGQLLNKLLANDPAHRPASAQEVIELIDKILKPRRLRSRFPSSLKIAAVFSLAMLLLWNAPQWLRKTAQNRTEPVANSAPINATPVAEYSSDQIIEPAQIIHVGLLSHISATRDAQSLLVAARDGSVEIRSVLNPNAGRIRWETQIQTAFAAIDPSGRYAALVSADGEIEIWNCDPAKPKPELLQSLNFIPDGLSNIDWTDELNPRLAVLHGTVLEIINPHVPPANEGFQDTAELPYDPHQILWRPKHNEILISMKDGGVLAWDPEGRNAVTGYRMHPNGPIRIVFNSAGSACFSIGPDKSLVSYDPTMIDFHNGQEVIPSWTVNYKKFFHDRFKDIQILGDEKLVILTHDETDNSDSLLLNNLQSDIPPHRFRVPNRPLDGLLRIKSKTHLLVRSGPEEVLLLDFSAFPAALQ